MMQKTMMSLSTHSARALAGAVTGIVISYAIATDLQLLYSRLALPYFHVLEIWALVDERCLIVTKLPPDEFSSSEHLCSSKLLNRSELVKLLDTGS